jgi:hypothetical protein
LRAPFEPFAPDDERYVILPKTLAWASHIYVTAFPTFPNKWTRGEITRFAAETSVVITASERRKIGAPVTICTCVGHPVHRFDKNELAVPGQCNKPHGVPVNCIER